MYIILPLGGHVISAQTGRGYVMSSTKKLLSSFRLLIGYHSSSGLKAMDLQLLQHYNSQHGGRHSFATVESHKLETNAAEAMCHIGGPHGHVASGHGELCCVSWFIL